VLGEFPLNRLVLLLTLLLATLSGCVERKFVIDSNPRGAKVYVNNVEVGTTPVDYPFIYYGTYNITLEMQGHQTETFQERIAPPWYAYPPADFVTEHVIPRKIRDIRRLNYDLKQTVPISPTELLREAEELRARSFELPAPTKRD
jgi:hypothetical protein